MNIENRNEIDSFLIRDTTDNANLYYLTKFEAPDPITFLKTNEKKILLVSPLEISRAKKEADVDIVVSTSKYKNDGETVGKLSDLLEDFLREFQAENIGVPEDFPLKLADNLRDKDFNIQPLDDTTKNKRKIKDPEEIEKLRRSQTTTEKAMKEARKILEDSDIREDTLYYEGKKLTSERIKSKIRSFLVRNGCELPKKTIVSSGKDSSKPHSTGKGEIKKGEPVIVDIFPRKDRYFGDMTRTFVKGNASNEIRDMQKAVMEAQNEAFKLLEQGPGLNGKEVHDKVCEVFEEHGYDTLKDEKTEEGFIHSTGHGVGLDLHEAPSISNEDEKLEEGMVITIEPGLYYSDIGGVRIEDMVLITEDGYENFNSMKKKLEID